MAMEAGKATGDEQGARAGGEPVRQPGEPSRRSRAKGEQGARTDGEPETSQYRAAPQAAARFVAQRLLMKPYMSSALHVQLHGKENLAKLKPPFIVIGNHSSSRTRSRRRSRPRSRPRHRSYSRLRSKL
jgi:hypothetical protein